MFFELLYNKNIITTLPKYLLGYPKATKHLFGFTIHDCNESLRNRRKDHLGSIRITVDQNNEITNGQDYLPLGSIFREYNIASTNEKYDFTEKERDTETGLNYFGARYYDSDLGRWTSVDPLAYKRPGLSPYQYAQNNPLNRFDPDGNTDWPLVKKGALQFLGGVSGAVASGYVIAQSGGTLLPVLGTVGLMSSLTGAGIGYTNIVAGFNDKMEVLDAGIIGTSLKKLGVGENEVNAITMTIATGEMAFNLTPTNSAKFFDLLNKLNNIKNLNDELRERIKIINERERQKELEKQKQEEEKKRQEEEKNR